MRKKEIVISEVYIVEFLLVCGKTKMVTKEFIISIKLNKAVFYTFIF